MSTLEAIKERQRGWAKRQSKQPDRNYLASVSANLYQEMAASTKAAFGDGAGSELIDTSKSPAKMKALHSSSALAVNFFDYWVNRDSGPLQQALQMDARIDSILFEKTYSTGFSLPHLDVVIEDENKTITAFESKFTEWLTPLGKKEPFRDAYFENQTKHWERVGLPECQRLARKMYDAYKSDERNVFQHLDAPQLLKHALGLAKNLKTFSLVYIYFAAPGTEADDHRDEIYKFISEVDSRLNFESLTYQKVFNKLKVNAPDDSDYLDYLEERYFG
ncbi:MAG: PGN_0703 family putative restriction endonuclease [Pseudohongiellaceae bacterium]